MLLNPPRLNPTPAPSPEAARSESRFRIAVGALVVLACVAYILGVTWDIQWHIDVGPDTFWTKSHLFFYAGAAIAGLASLYMVVATTLKYRRGAAGVSDANTTPWLSIFRAPIGFIISGLGALTFLLSGLFDLWWHEMFGFDITLLSPPHFGLLFSGVVICVGSMYIFASEANRARVEGKVGLFHPAVLGTLFSGALLLTMFSLFLEVPMEMFTFIGPVIFYPVVVGVFFGLVLMAAASFLRSPGAATLTSLFFLLLRTAGLYVVPPLVRWEAAVERLPFREGHEHWPFPAAVSFLSPAYIFVAGILIDLALAAARRYRLRSQLVIWAAAAVAFVVNTLVDQRWIVYFRKIGESMPDAARHVDEMMPMFTGRLLPTLGAVAVIAALTGWLGWQVGISLRTTEQ